MPQRRNQAAQQGGVCARLCSSAARRRLGRRAGLVGSLNIYGYTVSAVDPFDEALMGLFSVTAGQAITDARRWQYSRETVTQLERALISRPEIDMAKGALMAQHGCNKGEAFARLVDQSQRRNVKLHVIARELLASLQPGEARADVWFYRRATAQSSNTLRAVAASGAGSLSHASATASMASSTSGCKPEQSSTAVPR